MKSTRLADLFYRLNVNPFYVVTVFVFLVPILTFLVFRFIFGFGLWYSLAGTVLVFLLCSFVFFLYFHRTPHREIFKDKNVILSPADGIIVYVKKIEKGVIIKSVKKKNHMHLSELLDISEKSVGSELATGFIIGIELRLFDVHQTYAPISGKKLLDHHVSGRIVSMNNPRFEFINDRETVVIKQENNSIFQIAVVQIATYLTRTIKSLVRDKKDIVQGEPLGFIRLGSQVDVVLFSKDVNILVRKGDRVYGGITKIAGKTTI
jgi:phosphatidylserine decarboxylase